MQTAAPGPVPLGIGRSQGPQLPMPGVAGRYGRMNPTRLWSTAESSAVDQSPVAFGRSGRSRMADIIQVVCRRTFSAINMFYPHFVALRDLVAHFQTKPPRRLPKSISTPDPPQSFAKKPLLLQRWIAVISDMWCVSSRWSRKSLAKLSW